METIIRHTDRTFDDIVETFQHTVYNTAFGFVRNREDAEDIMQEAFITIYEALPGFRGDSELSTWIYRITVNTALVFLRKKKRKKRFQFLESLFGTTQSVIEQVADEYYHPELTAENNERTHILFCAVEKLPEQQRAAFVLKNVEGLRYEEIGKTLGITISAVESLLHRAKKNLQSLLATYYEQERNLR